MTILDADALLSSIDNHCSTGRPSRILRIAKSGDCAVFAADHVYDEAYSKIEKLSATSSASCDQLKACFEQHYLPVIRWVTTSTDHAEDIRVARVTDPKDVPTAKLASLVAPCLVLSGDKHLRRPGIAPEQWRPAAGHGATVVEQFQVQKVASMALGAPVVGVVGAGLKLGKRMKLPWWASVGIMIGGSFILLRSPLRRHTFGIRFGPFADAMFQAQSQAAARQEVATGLLKEVMFEPATPPTLKQQVATVLARELEPQLAQRIQEQIEFYYLDSSEVPTTALVRAILRGASEFTSPERYRWQLGGLAGPRRNEYPS